MLRSLLVGILAVSMVPACKGGGDAPAVQPGLAVGKVIELDGTVTATRDGKSRTLVANDEISGDDVIETNDGRVMIWLTFNNATWDLPPHRKERVGDSTAWKAEKVAQIPAAVQEATISGGRHAEKSAADTRESASATATKSPTSPPPPPAVQQQPQTGGSVAPAADPPVKDVGGGGEVAPPKKAVRVESKEAPPPPQPLSAVDDGAGAPTDKRVDANAARPLAPPPAPPITSPTTPPGTGAPVPDEDRRKIGGAPSPAAQLASHQPALAKCLAGEASLPIKLVVKKGKASITGTKLTSKQAKCFAAVAATFTFDGALNVELDYTVSK